MLRNARLLDLLAAATLLAFFCWAIYRACLWHDYMLRQVIGG